MADTYTPPFPETNIIRHLEMTCSDSDEIVHISEGVARILSVLVGTCKLISCLSHFCVSGIQQSLSNVTENTEKVRELYSQSSESRSKTGERIWPLQLSFSRSSPKAHKSSASDLHALSTSGC